MKLTPHQFMACVPGRTAFSLIELLVVMALLSVIILGLLVVFNQTQRAFRTGITQVDVLEAGRATMDLIARDLEQMAPLGQGLPTELARIRNFESYTPGRLPELRQPLPGTAAFRANILQQFFFLQQVNRQGSNLWVATAFFVDDREADGVGTLYRYTTNVSPRELDQYARWGGPWALWEGIFRPRDLQSQARRIADGVIHFRVTPFGQGGWALEPGFTNGILNTNLVVVLFDSTPSGVRSLFLNGAIPTAVEIELAVVEEEVLQRVEGLPPSAVIRRNYLADQAGKVHVFRQQVPIRKADERYYR